MALSNAERQKRYRETRKEKVSELDILRNENERLNTENEKLRNEVAELREKLRAARNNSSQNPQLDTHQAEEPSRPLKPKLKKLNRENELYYVEDGQLKLLSRPVTPEYLASLEIRTASFHQIDKKYHNQIDALIDAKNAERVAKYNEKVASWNAVCSSICEEQLEMAF